MFGVGDVVRFGGDRWGSFGPSRRVVVEAGEVLDGFQCLRLRPVGHYVSDWFTVDLGGTDLELVGRSGDSDPVSPGHYEFPGGVQVIDVTRHLDFLSGNVVKYVCRAGRKGSRREDLLKARRYLDWLIEDCEG